MASKENTKIEVEEPVVDADAQPDDEGKQGYEAWLVMRAKFEERARSATERRLNVNYAVVDRTIRGLMSVVRAALPAALVHFSDERKVVIQSAAADMELVAQGARFVAGQLDATKKSSQATDAKARRAARDELYALRKLGLAHLAVCVVLGHLDEETADQIRSGRGLLDAAQDCERMGMIFKKLWDALEPMQAHQKDANKRLTLTSIERMITLGAQVINQINAEHKLRPDLLEVDWKANMVGAGFLLEDRWSALRDAIIYHAGTIKDAELASKLPQLRGMR